MAKNEVAKLGNEVWGLIVFEGVLAVLFGIAAMFWPGLTLSVLVLLFAVFVLAWGIVDLIRSLVTIGKAKFWWLELLFSVLLIGVGVYLLRHLDLTLAAFILFAGFTFIFRGIVDVMKGLFGGGETVGDARVFFLISGALGLVAGAVTLMQPVAAGVALVWIIGLYAILQGSFVIALAVKARAELS